MNEKLFSEFPPITTEQWEQKILEDLKGADYAKKLIWKTIEGLNVKPYYRAEDLNNLEIFRFEDLQIEKSNQLINK